MTETITVTLQQDERKAVVTLNFSDGVINTRLDFEPSISRAEQSNYTWMVNQFIIDPIKKLQQEEEDEG